MKNIAFALIFAATICVVVLTYVVVSSAKSIDSDPRFGEIWKKSQSLRPQQSIDTSPVEFTIIGVKYKVPRNYISGMDNYSGGPQDIVNFKVTYPGFKPLTEETKQCLTQPRAYWPEGCIPIEFRIVGRARLTDDDHFINATAWRPKVISQKGPAGLELYQWGSGIHRFDIYRKRTSKHTLFLECSYFDVHGTPGSVCDNGGSPLPNGNVLKYFLDIREIESAEKIDDGIRDLLETFSIKGVTQ